MSTLLELVKDLDWPEGAVCVVQDGDGVIKWLPSMPIGQAEFGGSDKSPDIDGDWWFVDSVGEEVWGGECVVYDLYSVPPTSDWSSSIITKELWQDAQSK